jgi:hypothetical protein
LVLLIIQRFDLARWGFFTEFQGSKIHPERENHNVYFHKATFIPDLPINIFPRDDPAHSGINLAGRSTSAAGARKADEEDLQNSSAAIRDVNDMIVKFSWPEKRRTSEVNIIEKAMRIAENNPLVKDHIPTMLGHIDPPYLTCSTALIRKFLGLDTHGARVLRVIVFRRLEELRYLDEDDMLIAFLDCLFCEFFARFPL